MSAGAELIEDMLDLVVLEYGQAQFCARRALPAWFVDAFLPPVECAKSFLPASVTSHFLEHALEDALALTDRAAGTRVSEVWAQDHAGANEQFFAIDAECREGILLVLVRRLGADFDQRVKRMQVAREALLTSERLEEEVFRRTASIRQREEEIALRLLAAAGAHDTETGAHVRRIGLYSAAMAQALGWSAEAVAELRVAAPMHDVGKIGIPDRVLKKPGRLVGEEWEIMQTHTLIGAQILASDRVPLLALAADIALCHHECFDGSGYPRGLQGEDIPIAARIVAIVDVYDALVHRRVYKPAFAERDVIDHMAALSGTRFDPALLQVFFASLDVMQRIREDNPDESVDAVGVTTAVARSLDEP